MGPGASFMCIHDTAALLCVSGNYLTKKLKKLGMMSRREVWMAEIRAKEKRDGEATEKHGGGDYVLESVNVLAKLDTRTAEACTCAPVFSGKTPTMHVCACVACRVFCPCCTLSPPAPSKPNQQQGQGARPRRTGAAA